MTVTAPLWGVILGCAVVVGALFYGAWRDEQFNIRAQEEAEALDGLRRRPVPNDEIDHDYAP